MSGENLSISSEAIKAGEVRSTAKDYIEVANVLGFEQAALDLDFLKPAKEVLADLECDDIPESDLDAEKELYRKLTRMALETFYERVPSKDASERSFYELVDEEVDNLEESRQHAQLYMERSAEAFGMSLEEYHEQFFPDSATLAYLKARAEGLGRLLASVDLDMVHPEGTQGITAEPTFLRVPPAEGVDPNCIYFDALCISCALRLGYQEDELRVFLAGYHAGVLFKNFISDRGLGVLDPYNAKTLGIKLAYSQVPTEAMFTTSHVDQYPTFGDFFEDADYHGMAFLKPSLKNSSLTFLPIEDGILGAVFVHLGYQASYNGDRDAMRRYFEKARLFDSENSFVKHVGGSF